MYFSFKKIKFSIRTHHILLVLLMTKVFSADIKKKLVSVKKIFCSKLFLLLGDVLFSLQKKNKNKNYTQTWSNSMS